MKLIINVSVCMNNIHFGFRLDTPFSQPIKKNLYTDETHMYLNTETQYYNNQLHVGSSVIRNDLSRLRREAIIPLKSIII
jgi:hypothetical protein